MKKFSHFHRGDTSSKFCFVNVKRFDRVQQIDHQKDKVVVLLATVIARLGQWFKLLTPSGVLVVVAAHYVHHRSKNAPHKVQHQLLVLSNARHTFQKPIGTFQRVNVKTIGKKERWTSLGRATVKSPPALTNKNVPI